MSGDKISVPADQKWSALRTVFLHSTGVCEIMWVDALYIFDMNTTIYFSTMAVAQNATVVCSLMEDMFLPEDIYNSSSTKESDRAWTRLNHGGDVQLWYVANAWMVLHQGLRAASMIPDQAWEIINGAARRAADFLDGLQDKGGLLGLSMARALVDALLKEGIDIRA